MNTWIIIIGLVILGTIGSLIYMSNSGSGLWERQPSKIPTGLLSSDHPSDYTKHVYIGFSGMIRKWFSKK